MHVTGLHRPLRKDDTPLDGGSRLKQRKRKQVTELRSGPPCFEICRDASLGFVLKNASLLTSCNSRGQFTARTWLQHELAENIRTRNTSALILLSRSQDLYFLENATHP